MTEVILRRTISTPDGTFGQLEMGGVILCMTAEEPWRDNKPKISCIPPGTYKVVKRWSAKFQHHWHIQKVTGRTWILIHNGNTLDHTEGCVLVGRDYMIGGKKTIGVTDSINTMKYLRTVLPDSFDLWVRGK